MSTNYSSKQIITFLGEDLSDGYQGHNVNRNGAISVVSFDLQGVASESFLANQGGEIVITYTQGSRGIDIIDDMAALKQQGIPAARGNLVINDPFGNANYLLWNARLTSNGDEEWGAEVGTREATFSCEKLIRRSRPIGDGEGEDTVDKILQIIDLFL